MRNPKIPDWFDQRRLGIFIHWGVYSVPAYANEWYPRTMYIRGTDEFDHHVKTYGPHSRFGYKDFIPLFRAENFDPEEWIRIFQDAGAGYVFPVAEHHDGFQMYASELSEWNASDHGPSLNWSSGTPSHIRRRNIWMTGWPAQRRAIGKSSAPATEPGASMPWYQAK